MTWSIGVTAVGVAAAAGSLATTTQGPKAFLMSTAGLGLLAGPSIGRIYAHHAWSWGLGIRFLGFAGLVIGESMSTMCGGRDPICRADTYRPWLGVSAAVLVGGAALDIATTPAAVHAYNREHAAGATVVVTRLQTRGGSVPGVAIAGRF